MALDAGSVYVKLGGKLDSKAFADFDGKVNGAAKSMNAAERAIAGSFSRISSAAKLGGLAVGAAAVGGFALFVKEAVNATKTAANFHAELNKTQAVSGATEKQMRALRKAALDLGTSTGVGATRAAQAITELAKGGLSVTQIIKGGLKGALALAVAGEMDMADAATTVANALNLFGLKGGQATHVADALATAANATTADVKDFALALSQGGGAAKAAGLSFNETVAFLESLAAAGVKGSDAGTSMKTALVQLASPTKQSADLMKKLGLNFFDAQGAMKPLPAISEMLRGKLGDLTKEQRLSALSTIAGTDGMRGLLALFDAGPRKVEQFERGLKKQGTAAEVAAKQQEGAAGAVKKLGASWEQAKIIFGEQLLPAVADVAGQITDKLNALAADGSIKKFGQQVAQDLEGINWGNVVNAIGNVLTALENVADAVSGVINAFRALDRFIFTVAASMLDALGFVAKALDAITPGDQSGIVRWFENAAAKVREWRSEITDHKPKLTVQTQDASAALSDLQSKLNRLPRRVVTQIQHNANSKREEIAAYRAVLAGVPAQKVVKILQNADTATGAINHLSAAIAAVPPSKTVRITTMLDTITRNFDRTGPTITTKKKHAMGGKTDGPQLAMIGEGRDPVEWIIPRDPQYRGRAVGLLMDAAKSILPGHKAGTKTGPKRILPPPPKNYRVGDPDSLHDDIAKLEGIADDKVKGKLTARAREAKRELPAYRRVYGRAHHLANRIDKADELAHNAYAALKLADSQNKPKVFKAQLKTYKTQLANEARFLQGIYDALGDVKGGQTSKYGRAVNAKLLQARTDAQDAKSLALTPPEVDQAAQDLAETGMTPTEQKALAAINKDIALAALTEGLGDDTSAAQAKVNFLQTILGEVLSDPSRGGDTTIADVADQLKTARDNLTSLTTSGTSTNDNADVQAQIDQARAQGFASGKDTAITSGAAAAFAGVGSIGAGGVPGVTVVVNTLVPGDSRSLAAVAGAAAAGVGVQGYRRNPRVAVGP